MKVKIENVDQFHKYHTGVVARSKHHANDVNQIILHLKDVLLSKMSVIEYMMIYHRNDTDIRSKIKNVIWLKMNNNTYVLTYRHTDGILLINKNLKGKVIHIFRNSDTIYDVQKVFETL